MPEFAQKEREEDVEKYARRISRTVAKIERAHREILREILREIIPIARRCQCHNRHQSPLKPCQSPSWLLKYIIADFPFLRTSSGDPRRFFSRTRDYREEEAEGSKYLVEGPRSSPKHFRGRFFARTYFLRPVRVLIAQSIRARALSGAKKKSLNGDLFLLSFSSSLFFLSFFFLLFFFSNRLRSLWRIAAPTTIDPSDLADQCRIAAFATRRSLRQRRRETLNIASSSLNLPLGKIEFRPLA